MTIEYPSESWRDYEILDSGNGFKLERFGKYVLERPEPKALWEPSLPEAEWARLAHVRFTPGAGFARAGKEDSGTWDRLKKMDDQWTIGYKGGLDADGVPGLDLTLRLGLTAFKHVGVFPEQAPNWDFIYSRTSELAKKNSAAGLGKPRVLNLFAYTGGASLAAAAAGADVTHLDSVRQVVTWARDNMERSGLDGIRWVVEDALKFARRESRRGNLYQGIILDPPAYGHGPDGEKWKLDELLFDLLKTVASILAPKDSFLVLNLYSNGYSSALADTLVREAFKVSPGAASDMAGSNPAALTSGELALRDRFGKVLPLSVFVRLVR